MLFRFEETTFYVTENGVEKSYLYEGNFGDIYTINDGKNVDFVFTYESAKKEAYLWVDTVQVFKATLEKDRVTGIKGTGLDYYSPSNLGL